MARGKGVLAPALGLLRYRTPQHCKALHSMLTPSSLYTPPSLAQFPDFHSLSIVSLVGAIMPLLYASVSFISILVKGPVANVSYEMISKVRKQPVLLGCLYVIVLCLSPNRRHQALPPSCMSTLTRSNCHPWQQAGAWQRWLSLAPAADWAEPTNILISGSPSHLLRASAG